MTPKQRLCPTCFLPTDPNPWSYPVPHRFSCFPPRVCQGPHRGTHVDNLSHAVDFDVRVGTRVLCARDGVVVDCVGRFNEGAVVEELRHKANYVVVRHAAGGYSRYYHLHSVVVERGQIVRKGEVLGRSGNTGFTSGPHLHFDVVDVVVSEMVVLRVENRVVPCVPMMFTKLPFPKKELVLMVYADGSRLQDEGNDVDKFPFDSSGDGDDGFAIVCARGGELSFRQKAERAVKLGAKCLIVVDDDESMGDALPILLGDSGARFESLYLLFIAYENTSWLMRLLSNEGRGVMEQDAHKRCCIGISHCPFFMHDDASCPTLSLKPKTKPVHFA